MSSYELDIIIERPVAEVFAYLNRVDAIPEWASQVKEAWLIDDGPIGVGTRMAERSKAGPIEGVIGWEITEHEPESLITYRGSGWLGPADISFMFEPVADATRLRVRAKYRPSGIRRLLRPVLLPALRRGRWQYLQEIKENLERTNLEAPAL